MSGQRDSGQGDPQRLVYIHNARLPTEKAHGLQAMKMAEAFGRLGTAVEMWIPRRINTAELAHQDPNAFYALRHPVTVQRTPTVDLLNALRNAPRLLRRLGEPAAAALQTVAFGAGARARAARLPPHTILYMRDCNVAGILTMLRPSLAARCVIELHGLPATPRTRERYGRVLRRAAGVVALTAQLREELLELKVASDRVIVEHDAVDLASFDVPLERLQARQQLGLPADASIAAYIGRFHTMQMEKGIPQIIASGRLLLERFPKLIYLFVGGPMTRVAHYRKLIADAGLPQERYVFVDHRPVSEVPAWMKASDILLTPLPDAPFYARYVSPMKLFEYMAARRPIVASDLPTLREVVQDGHSALLARPGDPDSIADKLAVLLSDSALGERLSTRAFELVKAHTWEARAARILAFIQSGEMPVGAAPTSVHS